MILFELACANEHHFEAWFRDGAAYESQAAAGEIVCPACGNAQVAKAPMAPRLAKHHGAAAELRHALGDLRRKVQENCTYVGERFPEEARRIHYGETEARPIYGEASPDDARALEEEGVDFRRIPWVAEEN